MAISSISSSPLLGIQRGFAGLNANAANIASASMVNGAEAATPAPKISLERALVGLQQNSHEVAASTRALSAQNDMLGTLLDVMA